MIAEEIPEVIRILKICDLYYPEDDTEENFSRKFSKDKDLMLVATVQGEVVGFIMASYDGWAAMVWHLGVLPGFRERGIAKALMDEICRRLKEKGTQYAYGLVKTDNTLMLERLSAFGFSNQSQVTIVHVVCRSLS